MAAKAGVVLAEDERAVRVDYRGDPGAAALLQQVAVLQLSARRLVPGDDSSTFGHRGIGGEREVGGQCGGLDPHVNERAVAPVGKGDRSGGGFRPGARGREIRPGGARRLGGGLGDRRIWHGVRHADEWARLFAGACREHKKRNGDAKAGESCEHGGRMVPRRVGSLAAGRLGNMKLLFASLLGYLAVGCASSAVSTPSVPPATRPEAAPIEVTAPARAEEPEQEPRAVVPPGTPGWLGVELAKREDGGSGVLVRGVMRGSPAERAGVQGGDVVLSVDGQGVGRPIELRDAIAAAGAGKRVSLGVLRGDQTRLFAADLEGVPNDDEVMRRNYVGARAPDFGALDTVQGSITPTLDGLRGRVVVLEFWASWCGPCHVLAPTLQGWHDRYSAQGVTVLGVTNDPIDVAGRSASEQGIAYPLARDGSGSMVRAYRAFALPTVFVIDKQGKVRDVLIGYSTPRLRELEALVKKLIAEG